VKSNRPNNLTKAYKLETKNHVVFLSKPPKIFVTLLIPITKVRPSSLYPETCYPEWKFWGLINWENSILNGATAASIHIMSNVHYTTINQLSRFNSWQLRTISHKFIMKFCILNLNIPQSSLGPNNFGAFLTIYRKYLWHYRPLCHSLISVRQTCYPILRK